MGKTNNPGEDKAWEILSTLKPMDVCKAASVAYDDEFPARLDLLFDSTCEMQLSTDIIWSIAMMGVLIML